MPRDLICLRGFRSAADGPRRSRVAAWRLPLLMLLLLGQQGARADDIKVVTEEYPPYNLVDNGKVTGFSTEVVEAVLKEMGLAVPIQVMPWARAYDVARNAENVLIYSIARTPEREKLFKWVGVVAPSEWALYATPTSGIKLRVLDDAKQYQIATVNEDVGEQFLVSKGFVIGKNLQSSNKYEFNYDKLKVGRVDLWVANDLVAYYLVRRGGGDPARLLVRTLALPELGGAALYMAFSAKTSNAVVERFKKGLETIKKNGKYEALKKKWLS